MFACGWDGVPGLAGDKYIRQVGQPVNLLKVKGVCSNMMPLRDYLQAEDKFALSHSGAKCVVFYLDTAAFRTSNEFNTASVLTKLKSQLCPNAQSDVQLLASPCSHITVNETVRMMVHVCVFACVLCMCCVYVCICVFVCTSVCVCVCV